VQCQGKSRTFSASQNCFISERIFFWRIIAARRNWEIAQFSAKIKLYSFCAAPFERMLWRASERAINLCESNLINNRIESYGGSEIH
jgi:hypothetical protein